MSDAPDSPSGALAIPPGVALMPEDFPNRLAVLREMTGLSWEGMAVAMGVDSRQLLRWRHGGVPSGGAMLALVRMALRVPGGLGLFLGEDVTVIYRPRR